MLLYQDVPEIPAILLVSGNERNVGKTTLICELLKNSTSAKNIAIKISSHLHETKGNSQEIFRSEDLIITEEFEKNGAKDTARMLQAGADRVFFIRGREIQWEEFKKYLIPLLDVRAAVFIESAGLRKIIKPGLFIMVFSETNQIPKETSINLIPHLDLIILSNGKEFNPDVKKKICFRDFKWCLNTV